MVIEEKAICADEKSKKKSEKSPQKTEGVNRRNAILFTRKKAAQSEEKEKPKKKEEIEKTDNSRRRRSQEENVEPERDEFEFNEVEDTMPPKSPKSLKKKKGKGRPKAIGPGPDSPIKSTKVVDDSLFQTYRQGGGLDTDTDTDNDIAESKGWCSSQ